METGLFYNELEEMMIKVKLREFIQKILGYKAGNFWWVVYQLSLYGLNMGGGDCKETHEIEVLHYIKKKSDIILFDVGANVGDYIEQAVKCLDGKLKTVYCFEPSKNTYGKLSSKVSEISENRNEEFILENMGVGSKNEKAMLFSNGDCSGLASLYQRQIGTEKGILSQKEEIQIIRLDDYCNKHRIEWIDFLKLDIEGNEVDALQGAKKMINGKKIGAIQFEMGGCNIDSRTYLRDFWNLCSENYNLYRIMKNGITIIKEYDEKLENFVCANYLFLLK